MEVDMTPIPVRVTRSATKRARSPSSPGQYDRPSKRVASTHDASVPIAFPPFQTSPASHGLPHSPTARLRNTPQDWVSQTQSMRLESPASEQSGFSTPMTEEGGDVRVDEVMTDEPMNPNRLQIPAIQIQAATPSPVQMYTQPPLDSPSLSSTSSGPTFAFEDASMCSPSSTSSPHADFNAQSQQTPTSATTKRQRFTMGPRADCEQCRMRVKGHYMHFD
ncbi:hypothetical protein TRAPUB_5250 [Trametes pubescens]|uniref:Uncharacterized protein n=1 Tax=Trametes pubescens TaxID=154538 RepID=A0A1M2V8Z6_TRAPU|nr:hypothetical protein TRAPUB_5250 [Trametes pubescens]